MKNTLRLLWLLVMAGGSCLATNFSFNGNFTYDTDVQLFTFTLDDPTPDISFRTWSYSGGTNAAGSVIPAGGFEPVLSVWFADGTAMNPRPSGPCVDTGVPLTTLAPDPVSGGCGDVYYPTTLAFPDGTWAAGAYIVGLSTFMNPSVNNFSDGFLLGDAFGFPVPGNYSCQAGFIQGDPVTIPEDHPFCDEFLPGTERTGAWSLDILNVDSASEFPAEATPEPGTFGIAFVGAAMLLAAGRRKLRVYLPKVR